MLAKKRQARDSALLLVLFLSELLQRQQLMTTWMTSEPSNRKFPVRFIVIHHMHAVRNIINIIIIIIVIIIIIIIIIIIRTRDTHV